MEILLDELDKKIISYLCRGVYSYTEMQKFCGVGRSTIYRRIERMEKKGIIKRRIAAIPNYTKLNLSALIITIDINQSDVDRMIKFLRGLHAVKLLWRSYGSHNITLISVCEKGKEGECITKLRASFEKMNVNVSKFEVSISYAWEKTNLSPF